MTGAGEVGHPGAGPSLQGDCFTIHPTLYAPHTHPLTPLRTAYSPSTHPSNPRAVIVGELPKRWRNEGCLVAYFTWSLATLQAHPTHPTQPTRPSHNPPLT